VLLFCEHAKIFQVYENDVSRPAELAVREAKAFPRQTLRGVFQNVIPKWGPKRNPYKSLT
jgi:hypothetical protein